jgi:hypothetical protein
VRLAYADPPYPGKAHLYPENTEVDHGALIERLRAYDGWALSTDTPGLRAVLSLCQDDVCVAAWVRTNAPPFNPDGRGAVRSWEPLIYVPARVFADNSHDRVRDVLHAHVPNGVLYQGLTGSKPPQFARWMFALLGAAVDDEFHDFYPGSGAIRAAWETWRSQPSLLTPALGGHRAGENPSKEMRDAALTLEDAA